MPSRNEAARRTRARLKLESMPIPDDASLSKLQEQAEDYLREAKRRDPSDADKLVTTVCGASSSWHSPESRSRNGCWNNCRPGRTKYVRWLGTGEWTS